MLKLSVDSSNINVSVYLFRHRIKSSFIVPVLQHDMVHFLKNILHVLHTNIRYKIQNLLPCYYLVKSSLNPVTTMNYIFKEDT